MEMAAGGSRHFRCDQVFEQLGGFDLKLALSKSVGETAYLMSRAWRGIALLPA